MAALAHMRQAGVVRGSSRSGIAQSLPRSSKGSRVVAVRAAAEDAPAPAPAFKAPPTVSWPTDTETARDVFSFSGPLPERLNGRAAMLGFAAIAAAELSTQTPALEQFGSDWLGVALMSVTLSLASVFPKLVSGSSLADLHAAATSDNLKGEGIIGTLAALFDTNAELWLGRLAMLGIAGLIGVEAVTGNTLL